MSKRTEILTVGDLVKFLSDAIEADHLALDDKVSAPDLYGSTTSEGVSVDIYPDGDSARRDLAIWGHFA